jgi:cytochrome c-type biogenesis protein CcmH
LTILILACAGLVLLSAVFYLFPRIRHGTNEQDLDDANLAWFKQRREELRLEGNDALEEDAQLRLLEDQQQRATAPTLAHGSFPVWLLLPLVGVVATGLYYVLGAAPDVLIARDLRTMSAETSAEDMRKLISEVEARSAQRPDNLHYVALLGRYYMGLEDYTRAAQTYGELAAAVPGDAQALAYAAQAQYLAAGRELSDGARLQAEQALAVDPQQTTALGLLGMASFEQEQYRAAIDYWQRLLNTASPDSESGKMIAGVIATAQQRLAALDPEAAASLAKADESAAAAEPGAGVTVRVAVPADAAIDPAATVFILARNADSDSRMPIAVQRVTAAQLPITLRLDDSNSMAGQKLSQTPSVIVAVQVSPDGRPGTESATWVGQIGPLAPGAGTEPQDVLLTPNTL